MTKKQKVLAALSSKNCLKVIAGINNYDAARVLKISKAAELAEATSVDICDDIEIINKVLTECPNIAVTVSSIEATKLAAAAEAGATVLELGNFEALHAENIFPSAAEIRNWTREIISSVDELIASKKISERPLVSITVPGHLDILEQINLAEWLDAAGVDIIQTEGASLSDGKVDSKHKAASALAQIEKVKLTLASTVEIARVLSEDCFLLTASGISPETAAMAISAGADGIGVGKYVNKLDSEIEMLAAVTALKEALSSNAAKSFVAA